MGTNYYYHKSPPCPHCGRNDEPLHIGKSSGGWCFSLHVTPEQGINSLDDWCKLWDNEDTYILDEYDQEITVDKMLCIIKERKGYGDLRWDKVWFSDKYYKSEAEFHEKSHSQRGPEGLLRHRIGPYCIGHGEGTWDLCPGEFS